MGSADSHCDLLRVDLMSARKADPDEVRWKLFDIDELQELLVCLRVVRKNDASTTEADMMEEQIDKELEARVVRTDRELNERKLELQGASQAIDGATEDGEGRVAASKEAIVEYLAVGISAIEELETLREAVGSLLEEIEAKIGEGVSHE